MKALGQRRFYIDLILLFLVILAGLLWYQQPAFIKVPIVSGDYHELQATIQANYPPTSVKGLLYIPKNRAPTSKLPLIIYYHGGATSQDAYQQLGLLPAWAEEKGFLLLSIQNRWALNIEQDTDKAILDSLNATVEFIDKLVKDQYLDTKRIYATGFSGGGFVALCAGVYRPDLFAGIGDFKGNFYQSVLEAVVIEAEIKFPENRVSLSNLPYVPGRTQ